VTCEFRCFANSPSVNNFSVAHDGTMISHGVMPSTEGWQP